MSPLPAQFTAPGNGLSQIPGSLFPELTHYSSLFSHSSIIFFGKLANRKRSELGDLEKRQVFKSSRYNIFMKSASLLLSLGVEVSVSPGILGTVLYPVSHSSGVLSAGVPF